MTLRRQLALNCGITIIDTPPLSTLAATFSTRNEPLNAAIRIALP